VLQTLPTLAKIHNGQSVGNIMTDFVINRRRSVTNASGVSARAASRVSPRPTSTPPTSTPPKAGSSPSSTPHSQPDLRTSWSEVPSPSHALAHVVQEQNPADGSNGHNGSNDADGFDNGSEGCEAIAAVEKDAE